MSPAQSARTNLYPVPRWPTSEEAARARWFSPLEVGPCRLAERTWVPALVPWRASPEGFVTPELIQWYERFAQGQPGALVVEATGVRDIPSGPLLRASTDSHLPGLRQLVSSIKKHSAGRTRVFIQLIDFLTIKKRPTREAFFTRHLALRPGDGARLAAQLEEPELEQADETALRTRLLSLDETQIAAFLSPRDLQAYRMGLREHITDVDKPHIRDLPRLLPAAFAQAARRCLEAGFDGIELHFAHAYTLASFLSRKNTRSDGYGGSLEHRVRLPLEVYQAVRAAVGLRMAVGCRFLTEEAIFGGSEIDDALFFAQRFAEAGMDFLSLSRGGKFEDAAQPKIGQTAYPYTGPSGHECIPTPRLSVPGPFGRNAASVATLRASLRARGWTIPVVLCGGIASFWQAEEILAREGADVIASARQSLADPDWFLKMKCGSGDQIRRCLFTNYCEALDQAHKPVTCQLWDRLDGHRLVAPSWTATQK